ncbi:hypothetical protein K402DRAFT_251020 [Aulographum hederae CBS 113979]|uniref:Uncharacterized protein n=1 Tax=Aulographum hederae CBS 113979 TaxID=1176131 RepID=A0A6G1GK90_9PEZI|nr:hypothetical protein K402DRAFT_251020 [Aulographum hederae CBS 113979]
MTTPATTLQPTEPKTRLVPIRLRTEDKTRADTPAKPKTRLAPMRLRTLPRWSAAL